MFNRLENRYSRLFCFELSATQFYHRFGYATGHSASLLLISTVVSEVLRMYCPFCRLAPPPYFLFKRRFWSAAKLFARHHCTVHWNEPNRKDTSVRRKLIYMLHHVLFRGRRGQRIVIFIGCTFVPEAPRAMLPPSARSGPLSSCSASDSAEHDHNILRALASAIPYDAATMAN